MSPGLFTLDYKWTLGAATFCARTVVTAPSQAAAERTLKRLFPHVTVMPVDIASASVGKRNETEAAA